MERREEALNELEYVLDIISDLVDSFNIRTGKELYNAVFDYEYMFCDKGITINSGCTRLSFEPMDGEYLDPTDLTALFASVDLVVTGNTI